MTGPEPKRKRGRPRKIRPPAPGSPDEPTPPQVALEPQSAPEPPPVVREVVEPGERGHTRFYVREGQEIQPAEPAAPPRPSPEPDFVPTVEVTVKSDQDQRALIDEYGELDRRMQLRAMDHARYETLKKAIKGWFDTAPADADGTVEGDVYLLHLSARERERRVRDMRELVDVIGLDKVLELASVAIGALENLIGKARVAQLTVDARTGSRRIKAIAKQAAGKAITNGAVCGERTD